MSGCRCCNTKNRGYKTFVADKYLNLSILNIDNSFLCNACYSLNSKNMHACKCCSKNSKIIDNDDEILINIVNPSIRTVCGDCIERNIEEAYNKLNLAEEIVLI